MTGARYTTEHFVTRLLEAVADGRTDPQAVALRWVGRRSGTVTYGRLARQIERTAAALRAQGLRPGDRVLFSIRPRPEGVILCLAVLAAGGSNVFVDPGSTPELFAARLAAARPRWAATEALLYAASSRPLRRLARSRGLLLPDYGRLPVRHLYAGTWLPGVPRGARRIARLGSLRGHDVVVAPPGPDAEALVVFTSGTTADPRAVVHTASTLGGGLDLFQQVVDLSAGQTVHTDQMSIGLPALLAGATWEIPARSPGRDPVAFARGAAGADASFLVPADATALLDAVEAGRVPPRAPRTVLLGAAPVRKALLRRAKALLPGTRWLAVYGATEMLPAAAVEAEEKLAADVDGDLVGAPLAGVSAILDFSGHEDSDPDPDGAGEGRPVGELVLSGPSLMAGYLADLETGAPRAKEHRTGDLAWFDDAGRIVLVGRTRDMIIRGTLNIYPGLYEPRLRALPGVGEALLVGVPVPDGDERVVLVVVSDESEPVDEVVLGTGTLLARAVEARLPGVLDHGALPDLVVEVSHVPLAGRSRKPDRRSLAALVAPLLAAAQQGDDGARG